MSAADIFWRKPRNSRAQSKCGMAFAKTENRIPTTNRHECETPEFMDF
jgi:hypothetical protein